MAHSQITNQESQVAVVMVPLWGQGHLNQLLHLSRLVSAYKIPVLYISTTTHNRQAQARAHGFDPSTLDNLHFHDFPTPSFQNLSPNPNSPDKFPMHLFPLVKESMNTREPIFNLVKEISKTVRRVVVIYDSLMAYVVQDVNTLANVESYCFHSVSAFTIFSVNWENAGKPIVPTEAEVVLKALPSMEGCLTREFLEFSMLQREARKYHHGNLFNSNRVIESLYLDTLEKLAFLGGQKHFAIGPFNPIQKRDLKSRSKHKCLEWLDKQGLNSVILVSFGTTSSFSDEEIKEIAFGLEKSDQKFVWVLRDADKGDIFSGEARKVGLPEGYEERVKDRGLIVRDWAPQLEILGHPSTGGFMSHCGWNSCMESISMGVPIATWPMHSDQPRNALLLTNVLKIGVEVRNWACREELVSSVTVEKVVRKLMESGEGDEMRLRAKELARAVEQSVMEGGPTRLEMDSFIAHITRFLPFSVFYHREFEPP